LPLSEITLSNKNHEISLAVEFMVARIEMNCQHTDFQSGGRRQRMHAKDGWHFARDHSGDLQRLEGKLRGKDEGSPYREDRPDALVATGQGLYSNVAPV
jgi:hypothetical protein